MTRSFVTGNHAAGYALVAAGEANRHARGCCSGVYPITPQTEIIEYLIGALVRQRQRRAGRVGAQRHGRLHRRLARRCALVHRELLQRPAVHDRERLRRRLLSACPIVLVAVEPHARPSVEHLGGPGRQPGAARRRLLQFYCESHQDLVDTILLAFRVAEDRRILLPALVAEDGFVLSHTQMVVDLPEPGRGRRVSAAARLAAPSERSSIPRTYGGMTWPSDTQQPARGDTARDGPSSRP